MINTSISNITLPLAAFPIVSSEAPLISVLQLMSKLSIGHACVVTENYNLIGVFTDGDFRRMILNSQKPLSALLMDDILIHSNKDPKYVLENEHFENVKSIMQKNKVWDLPVINQEHKLVGLIHMSSIVK